MKILQHVQATRMARMDWQEAKLYLASKGIEIGETKFYQLRKFLEESVDERISHIAQSEYADMHVRLIDNASEILSMCRNLVNQGLAEKNYELLRWVTQEIRHYTELLKDLYAASPIVGRTQEIIRKKLKEAEELRNKLDSKLDGEVDK